MRAGTSLTALPVSLRFSPLLPLPRFPAPLPPDAPSSPRLPRPSVRPSVRFPHALSSLPPPALRPLRPCWFPTPLRVPLSLRVFSLPSARAVPPFSCFLSSLATPRTLFLVLPDTRRDTECRVHHVYTCTRGLSRTYGSQGFCSWRPILSDNEDDPFSSGMEKGAGRTQDSGGDTILPSCRGRDIFSLSRDNLETGVALPARECSAGERDSLVG